MSQAPTAMMWTVPPETEHVPAAAKLTARPEDAVAPAVKSGSP